MHILVAPNAFKGSLSAEDAAKAIAEGLNESKLNCDITLFPIADGGDGTTSLLNKHWNAEIISISVHDPLGRKIKSFFGWIPEEKKAVIGISDASGLKLLKKEELNPLYANTFGTGELIKAALLKGAKKIIIGVGGSATVDGGTGLLRALEIQFSDSLGNKINNLPFELIELSKVDISGMDKRIFRTKIIVLCDVQNKLLGYEGAARVFGPQKGADKNEVALLEQCLKRWNDQTIQTLQINMNKIKYGGAASGIAAGLAAYTSAKLVGGIEFFLDQMYFDNLLHQADLVITGEGSIDDQTLEGKGPFGVAKRAKKRNIPVIGMAGQIKVSPQSKLYGYFKELIVINPPGISLEKVIKDTAVNLKRAACRWGNTDKF